MDNKYFMIERIFTLEDINSFCSWEDDITPMDFFMNRDDLYYAEVFEWGEMKYTYHRDNYSTTADFLKDMKIIINDKIKGFKSKDMYVEVDGDINKLMDREIIIHALNKEIMVYAKDMGIWHDDV